MTRLSGLAHALVAGLLILSFAAPGAIAQPATIVAASVHWDDERVNATTGEIQLPANRRDSLQTIVNFRVEGDHACQGALFKVDVDDIAGYEKWAGASLRGEKAFTFEAEATGPTNVTIDGPVLEFAWDLDGPVNGEQTYVVGIKSIEPQEGACVPQPAPEPEKGTASVLVRAPPPPPSPTPGNSTLPDENAVPAPALAAALVAFVVVARMMRRP
jgi:hypothetical protein